MRSAATSTASTPAIIPMISIMMASEAWAPQSCFPSPGRLRLDEQVEAAIDHALGVEGHVLRVHHPGKTRVLHRLCVDLVAVRARLKDDPGEDHRLARLELDALREARKLSRLHVLGDVLADLERAMFAPDFSGLL